MQSENGKDWGYIFAATLCWGLARYDANEIVPEPSKGTGNKDREGHGDNSAD